METGLRPDPQALAPRLELGDVKVPIIAKLTVDGRLSGPDHGQVQALSAARIKQFADLAAIAVAVENPQVNPLWRKAAQMVATRRAPRGLTHLGGIDAIEAHAQCVAGASHADRVAVVDARQATRVRLAETPVDDIATARSGDGKPADERSADPGPHWPASVLSDTVANMEPKGLAESIISMRHANSD